MAFVDTAAIMQHLDLVVTSDTAIAHLAGALGRPVWVLLSTIADWRWLEERSDSPWYPTMRLFRQKTALEWGGVFREVAETLRGLLPGGSPTAAAVEIQVPISAGELVDKITILEIKAERIDDQAKLRNIRRELELLRKTQQQTLPTSPALAALQQALKDINAQLWNIEDEVRLREPGANRTSSNSLASTSRTTPAFS